MTKINSIKMSALLYEYFGEKHVEQFPCEYDLNSIIFCLFFQIVDHVDIGGQVGGVYLI